MQPIIVTSGKKYVDIDGLASALAYTKLLKLEGKEAEAVLDGPLNHTITKSIKNQNLGFSTKSKYLAADFVLVDVSEASHFPNFVNQNNIIEIYDHHYGFEKFWQERLGDKAKIETVGACATLIWEQYKNRGFTELISEINANLLTTAIVSNTLNFNASVASQRDLDAYKELQARASLKGDWIRQYFDEQEDGILDNVIQAIVRDTKVQNIPNLGIDLVIGQIELWDGKQFIENNKQSIQGALSGYNNENWFFICPSIDEGRDYIYTESAKIKNLLAKIFEIKFVGDMGTIEKLILRKEILKDLYKLKI